MASSVFPERKESPLINRIPLLFLIFRKVSHCFDVSDQEYLLFLNFGVKKISKPLLTLLT